MKALTVVLAMFALFAVAVPGYAETIHLNGNVPFQFVAGGQVLPSGDYTLASSAVMPGVWILTGPGNQAGVFLMPGAGRPKSAGETPRLVFTRYGDQYFLSQIWTTASPRVLQLRSSRVERAVARKSATSGTTTIAMR